MSNRRDDVFTVLKVIRQIVDETQEAIDAAIQHPDIDRALVDELRAGILDEDATHGTDLVSFVERIAPSITLLHVTCLLLIGERETLGKALKNIRHELELVGVPPRTQNRGEGARVKKDPTRVF